MPMTNDCTEGMFRRLLIVPFNAYFSRDVRDPFIAKKILKTEKAGILNRVLEGHAMLRKQRQFSQSEAVNNKIDEYRQESDTVLLWFLERVNVTKEETDLLSFTEMYRDYVDYVDETKLWTQNRTIFGKRIKKILSDAGSSYYETTQKGTKFRGYKGVTIDTGGAF